MDKETKSTLKNGRSLTSPRIAEVLLPPDKSKSRSMSAMPRFRTGSGNNQISNLESSLNMADKSVKKKKETIKSSRSVKSERRPITSSSTSASNSVDGSRKNSAIPKSSNYRPGQPGFSGSKLKINNRTYTAKPVVPAEKAELISVAEAMHREKFGERLQTMFAPETEAALKAMESGVYVGWRCAEYTWDCIRVGESSLCFCGHSLKQHQQYNGPKSQVPCAYNSCRCRAFAFIPSRPEDVGEFWLQRRPGYDPSTWTAICRCKHSHINHTAAGLRGCTYKGCRCSQFSSNFLCAACDRHWEDHETYFDTEKTRVKKGLPHGTAYIPFAEIPRLRNMALTGNGSDSRSYQQLAGKDSLAAIDSKPADNNTPVPFGYYNQKKSPFG